MPISVIGVDFRFARVKAREQVALTRDQAALLLRIVAAEKIFPEFMAVSTCNRTEFYFAHGQTPPDQALRHLMGHVAQIKGVEPAADSSVFFQHRGREAVSHLFRVVASLESQVVGEHEIMGQVKEGYRLACEARTAKFLFHKLMHAAFRTGKRVMTETELGQGTASVSQAAVDLAKRIFTNLSGKTAMLVGAGQTAELAMQALVRAGVTNLIVANRTAYKAEQLADDFLAWHEKEAQRSGQDEHITCPALVQMLAECPGRHEHAAKGPELSAKWVGLDEIPNVITHADLVICSTGAPEPVLRYEDLRGPLRRMGRSLLLIDIAVPRDIDPRLGEIGDVYLYNIDGLEQIVAGNIERRQLEIPRAAAIVDSEVGQFMRWLSSLDIVPTLKLLEQRIAAMQAAEIEKYRKRFNGQGDQLAEFSRALCNKILHGPRSFLRGLTGEDGQTDLAAISALREMFELDKQE